jgi:hypothetical protein
VMHMRLATRGLTDPRPGILVAITIREYLPAVRRSGVDEIPA